MLLMSVAIAAVLEEPRDLSARVEEIRAASDLSSLVVAAYVDGELVGTGAAGWLSMEHPTPVTIKSRYHIGSCTKAMTSALIGMLVERGDLTWDTPIAEALPGIVEEPHEAFKTLTVRQLLGHRAGISEGANQGLMSMPWILSNAEPALGLRQQRRAIAEAVLRAGPQVEGGQDGSFVYSNLGYILAGVIIEEKFDKSWEEVASERIFAPLGMASAGFGPPGAAGEPTEPLGHIRREEWHPMAIVEGERLPDNPLSYGPAGTAHASVVDWGRFVSEFEQGLEGHGKLLKQETYEAIAGDAENDGYALGWGVSEREWGAGRVFSHAGSNTYWYAVTWVAPEKDLVLLAATNMPPDVGAPACDAAIGMMVGEFGAESVEVAEPAE